MKQSSYNSQSEQFAALRAEAETEAQSIIKERNAGKRAEAEAEAQSILKERNAGKRAKVEVGKRPVVQQTQAPKQESEADILKKKFKRMTAEAFKMSLEIQEPNDAISVLNMAIPPAMAGIPMAIVYTAIFFKSIGQEKEAVKWADKLMAMDPQNDDCDVMLAKGRIYEEGIGCYTANVDNAIALYKTAAAKGNQDALCFVADMYYEGKKLGRDYQMALACAKSAYEAKNAYGLFIYGRAYYEGNGQTKDSLIGIRMINDAIGMRNNSYVGAILAEIYKKQYKL